jgi:hypothetical protein
MMQSKLHLSEFCIVLFSGRGKAQDLCIEFSLATKTMLMPIYRMN